MCRPSSAGGDCELVCRRIHATTTFAYPSRAQQPRKLLCQSCMSRVHVREHAASLKGYLPSTRRRDGLAWDHIAGLACVCLCSWKRWPLPYHSTRRSKERGRPEIREAISNQANVEQQDTYSGAPPRRVTVDCVMYKDCIGTGIEASCKCCPRTETFWGVVRTR